MTLIQIFTHNPSFTGGAPTGTDSVGGQPLADGVR
jgi:hypothetical protein